MASYRLNTHLYFEYKGQMSTPVGDRQKMDNPAQVVGTWL